MSDSASGPIAGYLFQYEKALVMLATLQNAGDVVSLERVDDVAVHDSNGIVILTVQAKHSISSNGTTFGDTSNSLWRTLEIWVNKLEKGELNKNTKFICATNKSIPPQSLVKKIENSDFPTVVSCINDLLKSQKEKLKRLESKTSGSGPTIKKTISLIKFILSRQNEFKTIKENLIVSDDEKLKQNFFVAIHMSTDEYTDERRDETFEALYGWLLDSSKSKWLNAEEANFSKKEFDTKLAHINTNPAIINAVFRKKNALGPIDKQRKDDARKELFVLQIEDIGRNVRAKERKIEKAILDYIYHDVEMAYIISRGNYTEQDFIEFRKECSEKWQTCFDSHVIKELDEYDEITKNEIAVSIFDTVMDQLEVKFQEGVSFTTSNRYVHNGTFLKLSNVPEIGWHPEWDTKYRK